MSPGTGPRVAVIIVTWNSAAVLEGALRSIQASEVSGSIKVIVVDNASADTSVHAAREIMPGAEVVQMGRNAGYAAGANAGIDRADDCDVFMLLNPDIRLEPTTIETMLREMRSTGAGIVVPRLVDDSGELRWSLRREPTARRAWGEALLGGDRAGRFPNLGEVENRESAYRSAGTADWATGAAMLISRDCAEHVGRWDESYFLYSEETDFALRSRDAGFELRYVPAAVAVHFEGESHDSPALFALLTRNRVKLYRSRHGAGHTAAFWAGVFVGEVLRARRPTRRAAAWALLGRTRGMARPGP
ncbi:glycosyltransferase family 2 protein [Cryobacterium algoritolerans]|uniref:Glycosyltransferase family 2 protein n=1 Tax=Cryobacterium algoritolerans TaxID=1259184 RepID=A0A4R8WWT8_9MICO|nr:glycosyltransferase family 2 protein [Cryobacterium algoritolerans]TFC19832.1 glycosyltransferase family 2 protein [Cryobacterium algoritolerans]